MYDEDNDGYVTAEEMKESLTNMFKARNLDVSSKEVTNTINQRIENLLVLADENGDGKLTREEIQKACKKDPSLLVMF
jgi:Ca2+-binding EF-hand superfamily protein